MRLELTQKEQWIVIFLLALLMIGSTVYVVRNRASWLETPKSAVK